MTDDPNNPKRHVTVPQGGAIPPSEDEVSAAKPMKMGRPKLPTGTAKGRIVHVRFTFEEIERIAALANASNKTISEWIRSTLNSAINSAIQS